MNFELPPPIPKEPRAPRPKGAPTHRKEDLPQRGMETPPPLPSPSPTSKTPPPQPSPPKSSTDSSTPRSKHEYWLFFIGGIGALLAIVFIVLAAQSQSPSVTYASLADSTPAKSLVTAPEGTPENNTPIPATTGNVTEDEKLLAEATPTPLPSPSPTPNPFDQYEASLRQEAVASVTPVPQTYRVTGVSNGDYLNVRQGPSANYPIVARLLPTATGIVLEQGRTTNGSTVWQQISKGGYTGWINADYVTLETGTQPSPYSGAATSPAIPTSTPIRTVSVFFERTYLIDERYGAVAENRIGAVRQYIAKYMSLRDQQSALQEKLKKSGPFGKSRLQNQLSLVTTAMNTVERDGDREIQQLRNLLQKAEVKPQ